MDQSKLWHRRARRRSPIGIVAFAILLASPVIAGDEITQADLLNRMIDLDRLYMPAPAGERPFLSSAPAGVKGKTTDDGWTILADLRGPGAIQSIWTEKSDGDVRIVTDGQPAVDGKWADFYSGGIDPFGAPLSFFTRETDGGNCWMPIGFSKNCRVLSKGNTGAFTIGGTLFPPGTQVARFDGRLDAPALASLERITKSFKQGLDKKALFARRVKPPGEPEKFEDRKIMPISTSDELKSKGKLSIDIDKPSIVRALYVSITDPFAPREAYAHHKLVLRIFYDGNKEAAVEAPLSAFYGSGFDRWPYKSSVMGTDIQLDMPLDNPNEGWFFYSYFPIPISGTARLEIENLNDRKIGVMIFARAELAAPPAGALRFNARYRWQPKAKSGDLTLAELSGKGRIVGSVLLADCPRTEWWGAGDVKLALDGGGAGLVAPGAAAWYANVEGFDVQRHAFNGVTLRSQNGKFSAYRWLVGDSLSFQDGARLVLSNKQAGNATDVALGHVIHWYGEPGAKSSFKPLKNADLELPGLRIPGAVELEGNIEGENWGSPLKQSHLVGVELSGEAGVNLTTTEKITAKVRAPAAGEYILRVRTVPGRSFKPVKFFDPGGKPLAEVAWAPTKTYIWEVGRVTLTQGENKIGIQCSDKVSLDCWILEPADGKKP